MTWGLCSLEKHTSFYILVVDLSFIVCQSSVRDPDCVRKRQRRNGAEIAIVALMRCTVTEPMLMLRLMIRELASLLNTLSLLGAYSEPTRIILGAY